MKAKEIREKFLNFFEKKGHKLVPSSSIIPKDDPTLLFTSAGMVQFKEFFQATDTKGLPYTRAVSCQKCLRAGGKKSDLENVGRTPRHHSFFEMLGNFSFGDYFKEEAIDFAWEFINEVLHIDISKVWVTVYKDDDEAYELWKKYFPESRIVKLGKKDNFWGPAGDTGPCGPSSELYYDYGEGGGEKPGDDGNRFVEFWNLVFTQFNMEEDGTLTPLKKKNIDTGMGLERIAAIMQGVNNNFYTDVFQTIIKKIENLIGVKYTKEKESHFHIIADHIRTVVFAFSDGVIPSNEGRGYVLRRILRRALRQAKILGYDKPFMYKLANSVVKEYGDIYPEIKEAAQHVENLIKMEEERFLATLNTGLDILEQEMKNLKENNQNLISGETAFKLYDTYGFPLELTIEIANEKGLKVDEKAFDIEMEKQREKGKKSWIGHSDEKRFGYVIENGIEKTEFLGYEKSEIEAKLIFVMRKDDMVDLIFDKTTFYGESGGQVGDTGKIFGDGFEFTVLDTQKQGDVFVHIGKIDKGEPEVGKTYKLAINEERRKAIAANHTATHLLHKALKDVLGEHVNQAGSLVMDERLRFDFTHFSKISQEELLDVERRVNEAVIKNYPVETVVMNIEEAKKSGATALFGEKYGEKVRVVSISDYSREFCGGTHLLFTGEIGLFKIVSESSVSSGVRRIEALTRLAAYDYVANQDIILGSLSHRLKADRKELFDKIEQMIEKEKSLKKEIEELKMKNAISDIDTIIAKKENINGVNVIASAVSINDMKAIRDIAQTIKDREKENCVVILLADLGGKVSGVVMVTDDIKMKYKAGTLAKLISKELGGGGGGRPDMAQCGGKEVSKIESAIKLAKSFIRDN